MTLSEYLEQLKKKYPDLRYGQILWNALGKYHMIRAPDGNVFFYITDDHFLKVLMWSEGECPAYNDRKHQVGITVSIGGDAHWVCLCGYIDKEHKPQ